MTKPKQLMVRKNVTKALAIAKPVNNKLLVYQAPPKDVFLPPESMPYLELTPPKVDILSVSNSSSLVTMLWQAFNGPPPKPPVVVHRIVDGEERDIDISGCLIQVVNALRKIVQRAAEKHEEREKAKENPEGGKEPETEIETLKKAMEDAGKAHTDFQNCLKKGLSAKEAVYRALVDEAKERIKAMLKEKFREFMSIEQLERRSRDLVKEANGERRTAQIEMRKVLREMAIDFDGYNLDIAALVRQLQADAEEVSSLFKGATAAYATAVKKTDGLTTMRPPAVKALEKARDTLDLGWVLKAINELETQAQEVLAANGRTNAKAKAFADAIDKLIAKYL